MEYEIKTAPNAPWKIKLPKNIVADVHDAINHPVVYDRYQKKAYCFACGQYFCYGKNSGYEIPHLYAGDIITCPSCGHEGRAIPHTRSFFADIAMLTARMEKETIYLYVLDSFYSYHEKTFDTVDQIEGEINVAQTVKLNQKEQISYIKSYYYGWYKQDKKIYVPTHINNMPTKIQRSVAEAVQKSYLKYALGKRISAVAAPGGHDINYIVQLMTLHSKRPQLEYLAKIGLKNIESDLIYGRPTYLYLNWKKRTLPGVLGLSPQEIDKLKQWGMFNERNIANYKYLRRFHKKIQEEDMQDINEVFSYMHLQPIFQDVSYRDGKTTKPLKDYDPLKTARYLLRVYEENAPACGHGVYGYSTDNVFGQYKDYIRQLQYLGYPEDDYYKYPKDFTAAHDRVSEEYREKLQAERNKAALAEMRKKEKLQKKYEKEILPKLEALAYRSGEYLIRPLRNAEEFLDEGRNNHNCVASYYDRAIRGQTAIFVIRKVSAPEQSFVTLELRGRNIVQCYGKGNSLVSDDVEAFANKWLENVVQNKKKGATASAA